MNKKLLIILIILSIFGFGAGFIVTKSFVNNDELVTNANVNLNHPILEVPAEIPKPVEITKEETPEKIPVEDTKPQPEKPSPSSACPKPTKIYEDETYLNVDQNVPLKEKFYIPSDLVLLDNNSSKSSVCLKKEAAVAFKKLSQDAKKEGYSIVGSSGFRDYYTQKSIVDRETKNGNPNVKVSVAKPGYSEHQLGVAVDITSASIAFTSATAKFGTTKESVWLEQHATEYGFVQSYPNGKEEITGYMYEPWHYRYVGIENAKKILESGKTVNIYLSENKI